MTFLSELKRRRVFRVAGAYLVIAWAAIEVADTVAPHTALPDWTPGVIILLAAIGLPVVVVLAWAFDIGPRGIRRTAEAPRPGSTPARYIALLVVVTFAGIAGYAGWRRFSEARSTSQLDSIAVLPFHNLSGDPGQEPFADGVSEEILNALARVDGLSVAARTSAFAFKEQTIDVREIARRLGVAAVLEGSVRKQRDRLRISVHLINAASGYQLWSETYDRDASDIFAVQNDIARSVVSALRIRLASDTASLAQAGTTSLTAHELYLLGLHHFARRHAADMRRAIEVFELAIAEDSAYAPAWAGLAKVYAAAPFYVEISVGEAAQRGRVAAHRALALDSALAEAYAALGDIAFHADWDMAKSVELHRRAIALKPSYAQAYDWLSEPLFALGRLGEALAASRRALELDPLSIRSNTAHGVYLMESGNFDAAHAQFERALQIDSTYGTLLLAVAELHLLRGDVQAGAATLERFVRAIGPLAAPIGLAGRALLDPSLEAAAIEALGGLSYVSGLNTRRMVPGLYLRLGRRDLALDYLEGLYASRDGGLPFAFRERSLAGLRGEPRFRALAQRLRVPI